MPLPCPLATALALALVLGGQRVGALGGRWSGAVPLGGAVIVTALGVGIALNGLVTYLG